MKDAKQLKRELDQQINQLPEEQLREVLDFVASLSRKSLSSAPPIEEKVEAIAGEVPDEVWEKLPKDGAEEHDHYIYGTPKRNG